MTKAVTSLTLDVYHWIKEKKTYPGKKKTTQKKQPPSPPANQKKKKKRNGKTEALGLSVINLNNSF